MPKHKLTKDFVTKLQPQTKDTIYWDTDSALGLKLTPAGTKSFLVTYRHGGKQRWFHIDTFPKLSVAEAKNVAHQIRGRAAAGEDPHGDKVKQRRTERQSVTFNEIAEACFAAKAISDQYEGHYRRWLKGPLGHRSVAELTADDFISIRKKLLGAGRHGTFGPVKAAGSRIWQYGANERLCSLAQNPFLGHSHKYESKEGRSLTETEIKSLWSILDDLPAPWGDILRLQMFTGQRHAEIRKMRWEEIEGDWWTQPTNKGKRIHRVYLCDTIQEVLQRQQRRVEWVFPSSTYKPYQGFLSNVVAAVRLASNIEDFHPHLLRHTAVTLMSKLGLRKEYIARAVNHSEGGVTGDYIHEFDRERKLALLKLERHLRQLVGLDPEEEKVVALNA